MKFKYLAIAGAFLMIFTFANNAHAQYMTTMDLIFLKVGWIPTYIVTYDEDIDDTETTGFAVQGEYNLNFDGFWLGFGVEYQRVVDEGEEGADDTTLQFIQPMVSAKLAAVGGLYLGAGVSGKYLFGYDPEEDYVPTKTIDLWANGILGYYFPVAEFAFITLEGRFGWNLTNNQFSELEVGNSTVDVKTKSAYDMAFYVGIGTRAPGTSY